MLNDYDPQERTCNLRVLVGPAGRDRGLETEAVALTTSYGIRDLGLTRITLEVLDTNPRGRRVYEKVGYRPTGHRDQAAVLDGQDIGALDMAVHADTARVPGVRNGLRQTWAARCSPVGWLPRTRLLGRTPRWIPSWAG